MIDFRIDVRGLDKFHQKLGALSADLQDKAVVMAINKTTYKAQAEVTRQVTSAFAIKANEVRNSVSVRGASSGRLFAEIKLFGSPSRRGRSMNLIHFLAAVKGKAVRGAKGVSAKQARSAADQLGFMIRRDGGLKKIPGAFIGNSGRTIFEREGRGRLPIKPVQAIGVSQMFSARRIREPIMAKIDSDFQIELDRAIKALLDK